MRSTSAEAWLIGPDELHPKPGSKSTATRKQVSSKNVHMSCAADVPWSCRGDAEDMPPLISANFAESVDRPGWALAWGPPRTVKKFRRKGHTKGIKSPQGAVSRNAKFLMFLSGSCGVSVVQGLNFTHWPQTPCWSTCELLRILVLSRPKMRRLTEIRRVRPKREISTIYR